MPHREGLRFKQTVVDDQLTAPPEHAQLRSVPVAPSTAPAAPDAAPAEVLSPAEERSKSTLMRWTDTEAIVPVTPRIACVVEEVEIPATVDPRLVILYAHASEQARAYGLLRHRLLGLSDPRVLTVTSARPGEGKTTCAANLALALADETMARVLLVEANLHRPALGEVFGYDPSDSFVSRITDFGVAAHPYPVAAIRGTRLHVAALSPRRARHVRLDRLLFDTALRDLRNAYDYIVIDAAAVLESADADVAGECADGVILTAQAQTTRRADLAQAVEQLHPARILGTVVLDT